MESKDESIDLGSGYKNLLSKYRMKSSTILNPNLADEKTRNIGKHMYT